MNYTIWPSSGCDFSRAEWQVKRFCVGWGALANYISSKIKQHYTHCFQQQPTYMTAHRNKAPFFCQKVSRSAHVQHCVTPAKGHLMHLAEPRWSKTLLATEAPLHAGSHWEGLPIRMHCTCTCSVAWISDCIKLLKGFRATCKVGTQPARASALKGCVHQT